MARVLMSYNKTQDTLRFMVTTQKANIGGNGPAARSVEMVKEDAGKILKTVLQIYKKEKVEVEKRDNCFFVAVKNATEHTSLSKQSVPTENRLTFEKDNSIKLYKNEAIPLLTTILRDTVCKFRACSKCPMRNEGRSCCLTTLDRIEQEGIK